MKRLDELTHDDLMEEHDRMMGIVDDGVLEGLDYFAVGSDPLTILEAKELYDELDQLRREEEGARAAERHERQADALRQPHYWKDKLTPVELKSRVWRKAGTHPRQLAKNQPSDG